MSIIKKISLFQFKNYQERSFDVDASVVRITGLNGVGKTNLLDAVYYLCYSKSYFTNSQQQLVNNGHEGFRLEGQFAKPEGEETVSCKWLAGKKEISIDGRIVENITDFIGRHTAVVIAPDDIELINGSSELRRKWMDGMLSQTDKNYLESLITYKQILAQRNAWLKMMPRSKNPDFQLLDYYNAVLIEKGEIIYKKRIDFFKQIENIIIDFHKEISNQSEAISLVYKSQLHHKSFEELITASMHHDMQAQRTLYGIHKDDLIFLLDNNNLKHTGSQGQKKSFLLAMKLAQYEFLAKVSGHSTILLLDDISEKLDATRLERLWKIISLQKVPQVFMTTTADSPIQVLKKTF